MAKSHTSTIRRHKRRTDDGKGLRRMIAGRRFRLPTGVDSQEADRRFARIEDAWQDNESFCRRFRIDVVWTELGLWAADLLRVGKTRVPLPPIDDLLASFGDGEWQIQIKLIIDRYTTDDAACHYPPTVDELSWDEAKTFYDVISDLLPSVNWILPEQHSEKVTRFHESAARYSIGQLSKAKGAAPPDPATPLINGTLHEALSAYQEKRNDDFTLPDGSFNSSGHHMVGLIRGIRERSENYELAQLDFERCQSLVSYWRERPNDLRKSPPEPLTKKTCSNYIGELLRFFAWLHLTPQFGWRRPGDFDLLNRHIRKLPGDKQSLNDMEVVTYSVTELASIFKHALPFERLLMCWCLNCAHGAAEFGRVEWGDVFLRQGHPWHKQGLRIDTSSEDNWCGFLRPKSGVLGWWLLWPETVELLDWWRSETTKNLGREPVSNDRVLLTKEGTPLYRDESRNAQTGFANMWNRLLDRHEKFATEAEILAHRLPFGTLRDQLPNWLGGEQTKALVASVALCHGIPHEGDKLLYKHYSNRPWKALFESQREFRDHLRPMFAEVPNLLAEPDPIGDRVQTLWDAGIRSVKEITDRLEVSEMTVRRRLASLGLT